MWSTVICHGEHGVWIWLLRGWFLFLFLFMFMYWVNGISNLFSTVYISSLERLSVIG